MQAGSHESPLPPSSCPHAEAARLRATGCPVDGQPPLVNDDFPLADAEPLEGQRLSLSTQAEASRIPNGEDTTWVFPSPQRFYNAMVRKGWQPEESDIPMVVNVHNTVNHHTWDRVMQFESFHFAQCPDPKLVRFRGRPTHRSPKSRLREFTGAHPPFDRHDWIVDRCGKEVRYVIDFYTGRPGAGVGLTLGPSVFIEARPAADFGGLRDRVRMWVSENLLGLRINPRPSTPSQGLVADFWNQRVASSDKPVPLWGEHVVKPTPTAERSEAPVDERPAQP